VADAIFVVTSAQDYAAFAELVREYADWCRSRYREDSWFVDQALSHQSLDRELETLPAAYGAPKGKAFLARRGEEIVGCCAYRRLSDSICEMKRLFVPDRSRGHGTGRRLCETVITDARAQGFELMQLDTANLLTEAIALYESIGFRRCPPYNDYPEKLMAYMVFMELPLGAGA
jgi:ribosomal protein S18 acetylase RimI-like enzyme